MDTVLGQIENLLAEFKPYDFPIDGGKLKLDDPLMGAFDDLKLNVGEDKDKVDSKVKHALLRYLEVRHYSRNISTLLYLFLHYLEGYAMEKQVSNEFYSRLTLDLEKIITDARSFLDSMFKLIWLYSDQSSIAPQSFSKFATWIEKTSVSLKPPLSFMREVVPWGLTIRQLRTDYLHLGLEAVPFFGKEDVFFDPYGHHRPVRKMPDLFYPREHPIKMYDGHLETPLYLRKFVVYVIAPVFALECVLGRYFDNLFPSLYPPWPRHGIGYPFQTGSHINALFTFIDQSKDVLHSAIYQTPYFIPVKSREE